MGLAKDGGSDWLCAFIRPCKAVCASKTLVWVAGERAWAHASGHGLRVQIVPEPNVLTLTQLLLLRTTEVATERTAAIHTEQVVFCGPYYMAATRTIQLSQCNSSAFKSYERSHTNPHVPHAPRARLTQAHTVYHAEHAAMLLDASSQASSVHHAYYSSQCAQ